MNNFTFAHLSDTHIRVPGQLLYNGVDSKVQLQKAIDWHLQEQLPIDATLISGDLTQDGLLEEYLHLKEILTPLAKKMPIYMVMGNHDQYQHFKAVFSDYPGVLQNPSLNALQYSARLGGYQLIVLDSLEADNDQGHLSPMRLGWLERTLRQCLEPTILVLHHPMIDTGNLLMDQMHLYETQSFGEIVAQFPQIQMILCGHIHRTIFGRFHQIPVMIAPSTAHQYPVNVTHESAKILSKESPGFLIHRQIDGKNILTHHIPLTAYEDQRHL